MPSVVYKTQQCGKKSCRCYKKQCPHGGYFWLVTYDREKSEAASIKLAKKVKRYNWFYLGKDPAAAAAKLKEQKDIIESSYDSKFAFQVAYNNMRKKISDKEEELQKEQENQKEQIEDQKMAKKQEPNDEELFPQKEPQKVESNVFKIIDEELIKPKEIKPKSNDFIKNINNSVGDLVKELRKRGITTK